MNIARKFTHETGKIIIKGEEVVVDGLKWSWDKLEKNAPETAQKLKEWGSVVGGYIGEAIGYVGDKVPDSVKNRYNKFLENTTPEERTFWEYALSFGAAGALKKVGSGIEKIGKLDLDIKVPDSVANKLKIVDDGLINKDTIFDHQSLKTNYRRVMEKPHVEDSDLFNLVKDLYRPNAKIGSGSRGFRPKHPDFLMWLIFKYSIVFTVIFEFL
jgi:hypothetical protein